MIWVMNVYLKVLESYLLVLLCDLHPVFDIVFSLVREQRLCKDSIKDNLALDIKEGGEYSGPISSVLSELVNVLSHQSLQKALWVGSTYRNDLPAVQFCDPASRSIQWCELASIVSYSMIEGYMWGYLRPWAWYSHRQLYPWCVALLNWLYWTIGY